MGKRIDNGSFLHGYVNHDMGPEKPVEESKVMVLSLSHGRKTTTEDMEDWGTEGPAFFIDSAQWTYGQLERIFFQTGECIWSQNPSEENWITNLVVDGLFFYDGVFYGDFAIWMIEESKAIFFDKTKSLEGSK